MKPRDAGVEGPDAVTDKERSVHTSSICAVLSFLFLMRITASYFFNSSPMRLRTSPFELGLSNRSRAKSSALIRATRKRIRTAKIGTEEAWLGLVDRSELSFVHSSTEQVEKPRPQRFGIPAPC